MSLESHRKKKHIYTGTDTQFAGPSHSIFTELAFLLENDKASEAENFLTLYPLNNSVLLLSLNGRRTRPLVSAIVIKAVIQNQGSKTAPQAATHISLTSVNGKSAGDQQQCTEQPHFVSCDKRTLLISAFQTEITFHLLNCPS